jgi:hypothetical protein
MADAARHLSGSLIAIIAAPGGRRVVGCRLIALRALSVEPSINERAKRN